MCVDNKLLVDKYICIMIMIQEIHAFEWDSSQTVELSGQLGGDR